MASTRKSSSRGRRNNKKQKKSYIVPPLPLPGVTKTSTNNKKATVSSSKIKTKQSTLTTHITRGIANTVSNKKPAANEIDHSTNTTPTTVDTSTTVATSTTVTVSTTAATTIVITGDTGAVNNGGTAQVDIIVDTNPISIIATGGNITVYRADAFWSGLICRICL